MPKARLCRSMESIVGGHCSQINRWRQSNYRYRFLAACSVVISCTKRTKESGGVLLRCLVCSTSPRNPNTPLHPLLGAFPCAGNPTGTHPLFTSGDKGVRAPLRPPDPVGWGSVPPVGVRAASRREASALAEPPLKGFGLKRLGY
jgi:hypothetical protein